MNGTAQGRLGSNGPLPAWLFAPLGEVAEGGRAFLLGQLLTAPAAAIMGSINATAIAAVALIRSDRPVYGLFIAMELAIIVGRLAEWRLRARRLRRDPGFVPTIDASVLLSLTWCTLQGTLSYMMMSGADPTLRVLSATLVMALIGPICARNYAAPRYAFLLVLLCDLPFVAGALASGEAWLAILAPITPPFLYAAVQIIATFHRAMLSTLAAEARNRHLAHHDSLTGILNRQGMDAALGHITPQPDRQMALLCIDLDGFKHVNDTHGHGNGDLLLVQVADRIRRALRSSDLVARVGGDEFIAIVRDISPSAAALVAEQLIAAISTTPYTLRDGTVARVGASIGFACLPEDAASTVELRLRADQALYLAKGEGKGVGRRYRPRPEDADGARTGMGERRRGPTAAIIA